MWNILHDKPYWAVAQPNHKAVIGSAIADPLAVAVTYKNQPVRSLPVVFAFQRGEGSIEGHVSTGDDGGATAQVVKIFGDKKAILEARVDVSALVSGRNPIRIVEAKFANDLSLNTGKFFVELEELSAFIKIEEELLGEEVQPGSVAADIKDRLHKALGIVFTKGARGADMEISGVAVVSRCTDFFQQRQCTADVNVTVTDRTRSRQLFAKKYKVKGNGEDDQEAGRKALSKAGGRIAREIIKGMK